MKGRGEFFFVVINVEIKPMGGWQINEMVMQEIQNEGCDCNKYKMNKIRKSVWALAVTFVSSTTLMFQESGSRTSHIIMT